jgi:PAS domain S-box-containing protein
MKTWRKNNTPPASTSSMAGFEKTDQSAISNDMTERYNAQQILIEAQERYVAAFQISPDSININKMDGTYVDVNNGFTEITGYTKEDVVGHTSTDLQIWADSGDRTKMAEILQKTGSFRNLEFGFRRKDGSLITALMSASIIHINGEPHILSVTRDITQRIKTENALRVSEEKYRLLAVNSSDVIWTMNLEGQYTYVSPAVEQLRGYTAEETMLQGIDGTLTPESAAIAHKIFNELIPVLLSGENLPKQTFVLEQTCKDGSSVWTELNVNPLLNDNHQLIGFLGVTRDITERRKADQQLTRIIAAVESASDGIGISDASTRVLFQNKAMSELFEFTSSAELDAAGGWQICIKDPEAGKEIYESILNGNSWTGEVVMVAKSGREFPASLRANSIKDDSGKITGLIGIISDISKRVQTEVKLRNSEEFFRTLAEYSPNMILIIKNNKINYANEVCITKLGYSREELYATDFDIVKLAAPEHQALFTDNLVQYASGLEIKPYEFLMTGKDGRKLYTMVNTKLIQIGNENAILGIILDISEQRWAEDILKRKAHQFENFTKLMVDRELKMVELKKEINELAEKLGEEPRYTTFGSSEIAK